MVDFCSCEILIWIFMPRIWNYFKVKEQNGNEKTKCQKCKNKIKYLKKQEKFNQIDALICLSKSYFQIILLEN